jgi:catechol 2,3-dioxygenase-like lactoylglutathione lyase family enzyme
MSVKRIVPNIATQDVDAAKPFYRDVLGMTTAMDMGWIVTFVAESTDSSNGSRNVAPQISVAREGGSGTPVPDLSVEVDDLAAVHRRVLEGGFKVEYGPVKEPWGVERFFVRDPCGKLINVLVHVK